MLFLSGIEKIDDISSGDYSTIGKTYLLCLRFFVNGALWVLLRDICLNSE